MWFWPGGVGGLEPHWFQNGQWWSLIILSRPYGSPKFSNSFFHLKWSVMITDHFEPIWFWPPLPPPPWTIWFIKIFFKWSCLASHQDSEPCTEYWGCCGCWKSSFVYQIYGKDVCFWPISRKTGTFSKVSQMTQTALGVIWEASNMILKGAEVMLK